MNECPDGAIMECGSCDVPELEVLPVNANDSARLSMSSSERSASDAAADSSPATFSVASADSEASSSVQALWRDPSQQNLAVIKESQAHELFGLDDVPNAVLLGSYGGKLHYYHNKQGLRICSYWYPAHGAPKATIIAIHGHGVYFPFAFLKFQAPGQPSTYAGSWVEALNARGYAVAGIDMQSCGRSEGLDGLRCHIGSWRDVVDDEVDFVRRVRGCGDAAFAAAPVFLLGASMGGCAAVHSAAALQAEPWFKGCVLLAPMLSLDRISRSGVNALLEPIGAFVAYMLPTLALVRGNPTVLRERIPELYEGYAQDPGVYSEATRLRVASEYLAGCRGAQALAPSLHTPLLAFHAPDDLLTDPAGTRELIEAAAAEDKALVSCPGMFHELVHEEGERGVFERLVVWLSARTGGAAQAVEESRIGEAAMEA